jgi:hypothetical protein
MSNNQIYPYEALNNNDNNGNRIINGNVNYLNNQHNLIPYRSIIVRQTYTYETNLMTKYDNNKSNKNNLNINKNNLNSNKNNNNNNRNYNSNNNKHKHKKNAKKKSQNGNFENNYKVDIKSPKNNNCNYIITNTKEYTELISIHKDIYNEYHEDIHKLFGRVEFHMKKNNFKSFNSFWTEIWKQFRYIYNIYDGNDGNVSQHTMEKTFKDFQDKITILTKK